MKKKSVNFIGFFWVCVLAIGISAVATTPSETVIRLKVNVNELETECVKSDDIELNSLFWRIVFCKSSNFVNATLVSYSLTEYTAYKDGTKWSCSADAVFKLHSQLNEQELESKLPKQKFDIENPSHGITEFVKWDEMLANYVHENQSYFEVKISTYPPIRSRIRLTVDINELETKCVKSNDFELNSLFWRIELCKSSNFISASLDSYLTEDAPKWSCRAEIVFKLHSPHVIDFNKDNILKRNFDIENPSHGISKLAEWGEMLEDFAVENECYFEIKISTDPPVRSLQSELISLSSDICFKNVSTLDTDTSYFSQHFVVRGIRWQIGVKKQSDHLEIYLYVEEDDLARNESWEVNAKFMLYTSSQDSSVDNITETFITRFGKNYATGWGYDNFLEWNEFINPKNEYIKNDTAWFNVDITVSDPKLE